MLTRVLAAVGISTLALVACSSDVQGPSGGGPPGAGGSSSGHSSSGTSGGTSGTSGSTSGGTSGTSGTTSGGTSSSGGSSSGNPVNTETWADGKTITANIDIVAGATVTIAPGAKVTISPNVSITVHGTLTASAKASHAKLTGTGWGGIIVASGGSMTLIGVDLENATTGIHVNGKDLAAEYDYGTLTGGIFTVDVGGTFKTDHAAVVKGGTSNVDGAFTATFLDYAGQAITMSDPSATLSAADSKFTGNGTPGGNDFFEPGSAALLHLEYSTITNTHCPIHSSSVAKMTLDHVATSGNGYGLMVYNADVGPHTISFSSFDDPDWNQDTRTAVVNIDHTYIKNLTGKLGQVTITNAASAPVSAAAPRGKPGPA